MVVGLGSLNGVHKLDPIQVWRLLENTYLGNKVLFIKVAPVAVGCKRSRASLLFQDVQALGMFAGDHNSGYSSSYRGRQSTGFLKGPDCVGPGGCLTLYLRCSCNKEEAGRKVAGLNPGAGKVFQLKISAEYIAYSFYCCIHDCNACETHSYVSYVTWKSNK